MKELSCPLILLVLCIVGLLLTGCATYKVRVPLGADEKFGAVDVGVTYYPPRDFAQWYDHPPLLRDK